MARGRSSMTNLLPNFCHVAGHALTSVSSSSLQPVAPSWVWALRIPRDSITVIAGDPGVGKGYLGCWLAWAAGTGSEGLARCRVALIGLEDSRARVATRLRAAGAEAELLGTDDGNRITFPSGTNELREYCHRQQVDLVVIDPFENHLDDGINPNQNKSLRSALSPLAQLCDEGVTVILCHHLTKSVSSGQAMYRLVGSIGYSGVARSVLGFGIKLDDPIDTDDRYLVRLKGNYGKQPDTVRFKFDEVQIPGTTVTEGRLAYIGLEPSITENLIFGRRKPPMGRPPNEPERLWIDSVFDPLLPGATVPVQTMQQDALAQGFVWRTCQRVRVDKGIISEKDASGTWVWRKP
jgi:AAA domain